MSDANKRRYESESIEERKTIFKYSNYDYRIILGTIQNQNSISWDWHVIVSDWESAKKMIDLWHESKKYPAFRIKLEYRGDEI